MSATKSWLRYSVLVLILVGTSSMAACDGHAPTRLEGGSELESNSGKTATAQYKGGEFQNPYRWVGQVHNAALDYTLAEFETFAQEHGTISPERMRALGARHIRRYLQERLTAKGSFHRALQWGFRHKPGLRALTNRAGFNKRQMHYLRKVREITDWGDYDDGSPAPFLRQVDELEKEAVRELGRDEARPVLLASAVSAHTMQYWNSYETRHRWKNVGYELLERRRPGEVTLDAEVGDADVAGAIGGAATAFITGCGELSLGACAAAAAAAGAISASLEEYITHVL